MSNIGKMFGYIFKNKVLRIYSITPRFIRYSRIGNENIHKDFLQINKIKDHILALLKNVYNSVLILTGSTL